MSVIGARLRRLRVANRMSITDVSQRTGISRSQICDIENDKADPRLSTVTRLLHNYGADLGALLPEPVSIDEVRGWARAASELLDEVGMGPSDPDQRLGRKQDLGERVEAERDALFTRR